MDTPAFKLSEITAMQFRCIKELNKMINDAPNGALAESCKKEIVQRKHWAMNPIEVQV